MEIKEFVEKFFVPALVENRETGNIELNINQSVWDNPVRVPTADEDIFIHCRKGHVLKANINDLADIVDKGCPFCKRHVDERYIKYMTTYESLGFIIDKMPKTLGQYRNVKCLHVLENGENWSVINPWMINVNTIKRDREHWKFIVFDRNKRDITEEICNIAEELWLRAFNNTLYDQNAIILPTKRSVGDMSNVKLEPEDFIIRRCNCCGKIQIISACRIAAKETYCVDCGTKLFDAEPAWYGVEINETNSGYSDLMWMPRVDTVTTLAKLRKHVREENIKIDGIKDCSS